MAHETLLALFHPDSTGNFLPNAQGAVSGYPEQIDGRKYRLIRVHNRRLEALRVEPERKCRKQKSGRDPRPRMGSGN